MIADFRELLRIDKVKIDEEGSRRISSSSAR